MRAAQHVHTDKGVIRSSYHSLARPRNRHSTEEPSRMLLHSTINRQSASTSLYLCRRLHRHTCTRRVSPTRAQEAHTHLAYTPVPKQDTMSPFSD